MGLSLREITEKAEKAKYVAYKAEYRTRPSGSVRSCRIILKGMPTGNLVHPVWAIQEREWSLLTPGKWADTSYHDSLWQALDAFAKLTGVVLED